MINLYYYKLEEAEKLKETYSSWIGKQAHIGKGVKDTLQAITIKPKRGLGQYDANKIYKVEFQFGTKKRFSAHEFLFHNSLVTTYYNPYIRL